jgi:hypothetical protein
MKPTSLMQLTYEVLEMMPEGKEFTGNQLRRAVMIKHRMETGIWKEPYHDTILRCMRYWRTSRRVICINRARSLYRIS